MSRWKLLRAAVWLLGISLVSSGASKAADLTVNSGQTLTTTQDIGTGSTVLIEKGAVIEIPASKNDDAITGTNNNTVINYGRISSLGSGPGIHVESENSIINYGTIETSAQSSLVTSEDALDIHGGGNSVVNWGLIRVYDSINGYGVHIADGNESTLTNHGTIATTGKGSNAVHAETTGNRIINHGTIITSGTLADGVYITDGNTLINSGTLISTYDDAIHMNGTNSEIYLLAGSAVYGGLDLHDSSNHSFDIGNGLNAMLTFENYLPAHINTNGMPSVTDPTDLQLAVVDPTGFAMAEDLLVDISDQAFDAVRSRLRPRQEEFAANIDPSPAIMPAADVYPTSIDGRGPAAWASVIGSWRQQSAAGITWSGEQQLKGMTAGVDLNWTPSLRVGAFAGAAKAELSVDDEAQEIDTDNFWGGAYVGGELGDYQLELAALAGWQSNDSVRRMVDNTVSGGVDYANANYDGFFVSPQASISRNWNFAGQPINSTLTLRYSGLFLEDYEEEGSNADLTVEARDVHLLTARGEIARLFVLPHMPEGLQLVAVGGGDVRYTFGDEVAAVLLDQNISFDPDDRSITLSGFGGGKLMYSSPSDFLTLGLSGKAVVSTDDALVLAFQASAALHF
jgi:autotransporter-like protein